MKISSAIKEVESSAGPAINVLAYLGIGLLVVGVIVSVVGGGTVSVPSAILTYLNGTNVSVGVFGTSTVSVATALITALTTIIGLVIVAVLWKFFGLGKKNKGKSM